MMWTVGFEPVGAAAGETKFHGYNTIWGLKKGEMLPAAIAPGGLAGAAKWVSVGGSLFGAGFSVFNMAHGFSENGLSGVKDAGVWDLAIGGAAARFAYGTVGTQGATAGIGLGARVARAGLKGIKIAGAPVAFGGGAGTVSGFMTVGGAGIGASLGQAVLGTPGAFMGAYVGAAPIRFAATHPLLALGMAGGTVAAAVGYGAYSVVKGGLQAGYAHSQRQRGINTSGSMAAFMTSGAQTMRARAVQSIHKSHMNARSALGQEASFMHMPGKNYHSGYR